MYVPESKIIQLFLKSMCPAQKRCHPSQSSATCNLFCLRVSGYVSGALIASWALPRPCRLFLGSRLCEGLLSEAACFQRNRALGWLYFIFRAFPFIFPGGVPLGAAPRPLRAVRLAVVLPLPGSPLLLTSARAGHWHWHGTGQAGCGRHGCPVPLGTPLPSGEQRDAQPGCSGHMVGARPPLRAPLAFVSAAAAAKCSPEEPCHSLFEPIEV